jgi:hypothetical protein
MHTVLTHTHTITIKMFQKIIQQWDDHIFAHIFVPVNKNLLDQSI